MIFFMSLYFIFYLSPLLSREAFCLQLFPFSFSPFSFVRFSDLSLPEDKTARQYYGYSNSNNNNGYSSASSSQAVQQPASAAPAAHTNGYANDYTNYQQLYSFYDNYGSASDYAQDYA